MITEKLFAKQNALEHNASCKTERDAGVVRSNDLLGVSNILFVKWGFTIFQLRSNM
jgi:hypothetical protein